MKKHILMLTGDLPWPLNSGGKRRTWQFVEALKDNYELSLCSLYREEPSENDIKLLKQTFNHLWMVPRTKADSSKSWMQRLKNNTQGISWQMSADYNDNFSKEVAKILKEHTFDAVLARYIYQGRYLFDHPSLMKGKFLLDLDDIETKKYARMLKHTSFKNRYDEFRQNKDNQTFKEYHRRHLNKCDAVFVCSEDDREFIKKEGWKANGLVIPNSFSMNIVQTSKDSSEKIFVFCGTLNYEANEDAVLWFIKDTWPKIIEKEPKAKFYIVGRNPTSQIRNVINGQDIYLFENVEDLSTYYQKAAVCVVPIRFAAGTRVKILEAATFQVPVVSTSVGAEGLELIDKKHCLLADDAEGFAQSCLKLLSDKKLSADLAQNNYQFIRDNYDTKIVQKKIKQTFDGLLNMQPTIAYYSNTLVLGGSEVYLKNILEHIDNRNYKILFFGPLKHPLASWIKTRPSITHIHLDDYIYIPEAEEKVDAILVEQKRNPSLIKRLWKFISPKSLKLLAGTARDILKIKKMFKSFPIDLIHFNDTGCEPPVVAARLAGIKQIVGTFHVEPSYENEKKTWVHRLTEFLSLRCLHQGISVSNAVKASWINRTGVNENKIMVIYNGIDLKAFPIDQNHDVLKKELNITNDERVICVPARLHPMKGHRVLIDSVKNHLNGSKRTKFLFVGDGPLRKEIEETIKTDNLSQKIKLLGFRNDIRQIMAVSDLIVLPSVSLEALPYVLIEAMACFKPVVATNFSGIPEVVDNQVTGLLVARHDPQGLASAIESILNDQNKAVLMGQQGRRRVEDLFTQERMIKETFQVYDILLKAGRA
jgi:glycosyltransferase involved in cell wall biosynthesis